MLYTWTKDIETGNQIIDTQHKQLFEAINQLIEACNKGKGQQEVNDTMNFLIDYTVKHFNDEENLQNKYKYPGFDAHKVLHEEFKKMVVGLSEQLKAEGVTISLIAKVNSSIGTWLRNHIKREDKKVAEFIRNNS